MRTLRRDQRERMHDLESSSARLHRLAPALLLAALVLAGCGGSSSSSKAVPAGDVALVGGEPISSSALGRMVASSSASLKAQNRAVPVRGTAAYAALQARVLTYLVQQSEFEQRAAQDLGVRVSDAQVSARLAKAKRRYYGGSDARFRQALASNGLDLADVRSQLRDQLLAEATFAKVTAGVTVPDARVRVYYDAHPRRFETPAHREVRHILVRTKAQAQRIEQQLAGGADFATLARKYSTDTGSSSLGGRLKGGVSRGQTVPSFEKVAFALKTGEISSPVHSRYGWHVIQALSPVQPARTTPYAEARASILAQLLQAKKNAVVGAWTAATVKEFASRVVYAPGYAPARP